MLHQTMMLGVNLPLVGAIYSQSNKFVTSVKMKATGDSKLNDSRKDPPRGGGGYSGFLVTGMIECRQKNQTQKIPRASNKTPKDPGPKINPPKNLMPNFQALNISRKDYMI